MIDRVLSSTKFDVIIGLIITGNAITIGVEQSYRLDNRQPMPLQILEHIFLVIYVVELVARFYAHGIACLKCHWVKFDAFLVTTGTLYAWIVKPLSGNAPKLRMLLFLRLLRLLRLGRVLRLLIQFRELYTLVRAMTHCASTIVYTLGFLFTSIYVFSCVGVELIAHNGLTADPEFQVHVDRYFRSLPVTMFTLIRFACMDDMSDAYETLVDHDWTLAIYFISVILVVGIVFMNLLAAAVINSALEQSSLDRDALKQAEENGRQTLLHELRSMFHRIDIDKSGQITRSELRSVNLDDKSSLCEAMGTSDLTDVFKKLDVDDSGSVDIDEFVDGMEIALSSGPMELKRVEAKMNIVLGQLRKQDIDQQNMIERWKNMLAEMPGMNETRSQTAHLPLWAEEMTRQLASQTEAINAILQERRANLNLVDCSTDDKKRNLQPRSIRNAARQRSGSRATARLYTHPAQREGWQAHLPENRLERENAALKQQLLAADAALLEVLQRTRGERLKIAPVAV